MLAVGRCISSAGRIVIDGRGANPASLAGIAELPVQKYNCKKFMFHDMTAYGIQNPFQTICSIQKNGKKFRIRTDCIKILTHPSLHPQARGRKIASHQLLFLGVGDFVNRIPKPVLESRFIMALVVRLILPIGPRSQLLNVDGPVHSIQQQSEIFRSEGPVASDVMTS